MSKNTYAKSTKKAFAEGECCIEEVIGLQQKFSNKLIYHLLGILSFGIIYLACVWEQKLKIYLAYKVCQIENATHFLVKNWDKSLTLVPKIKIPLIGQNAQEQYQKEAIGFENRFLKYYFNNFLEIFQCVEHSNNEILKRAKPEGPTQQEYLKLHNLFGNGNMEIPIPSYPQLFVKEILNPFFVFQVYSVLLWCYEEYYAFAIVICTVTTVSSVINLITIRENLMKIREMAEHNQNLNVIRQGEKVNATQKSLVPGDIIQIQDDMQIPVDCILIKGNVLMNESSLTGESIPIFKSAIDCSQYDLEVEVQESKIKKNTLFCGTQVLQAHQKEDILAVVIRTSFATLRGQLIRSIMFPKPSTFRFFQESMKFLGFLFLIVLSGYIIVLPRFSDKLSRKDLFLKFLDLITIAVPPQLTAALQVGISFSLQKLEKNQIYCISPPKVVVGGVIDTICFDKTGTLTEDGMILKGILPCVNKAAFYYKIMNKKKAEIIIKENYQLQNSAFISYAFNCMATCHSLIYLKDQLLGDPMEKELFILTKAEFHNYAIDSETTEIKRQHNKQSDIFKIIKRFDFTSEAQCMSVVVENQGKTYVYAKGASEKMFEISVNESIPLNYEKMLENYSQAGYRIITLGFKEIQPSENYKRVECEQDLIFLGFVFFENPVKKNSESTIETLNSINISSIMITGDNILTACEVARSTKIIQKNQQVVFCKLDNQHKKILMNIQQTDNISQFKINSFQTVEGQQNSKFNIESFCKQANDDNVDDPEEQKDSQSDHNTSLKKEKEIILNDDKKEENNIQNNCVANFLQDCLAQAEDHIFVIPGNVFAEIMTYIERNKEVGKSVELKNLITRIKVYARMKPNQKTQAVELLQSFNRTVAMVGDGANDCGALKQADVGLSLSQQEASISAPFTSKNLNIDSILDLLKQSRAGLATSFQSFKFMALDSLIEFTTTIILYYSCSMPADMQFLFWDLFLSSSITVTMSMTDACDKLSIQKPPSSLLGSQCMTSVFGQAIIQSVAQVLMVFELRRQQFFQGTSCDSITDNDFPSDTMEVTTIFIFVNIMYLACISSINIAKPFRKPFYSNWWFTINFSILLLYNFAICLFDWIRIPNLKFQPNLSSEWLVRVFLFGIIGGLIIFLYENLICVKLFEYFNEKKQKQQLQLNQKPA